MALIQIDRNPSDSVLRWFGVMLLAFFGLIGGLVWLWGGALTASIILWGVGGVLFILFYALRPLQRPFYLGWIYAALPIGLTVSFILLGVVYFLVLTPIALVLRLLGRDALALRYDEKMSSYWTQRQHAMTKRYFRQF